MSTPAKMQLKKLRIISTSEILTIFPVFFFVQVFTVPACPLHFIQMLRKHRSRYVCQATDVEFYGTKANEASAIIFVTVRFSARKSFFNQVLVKFVK